jgi:hypothetical protein
MKLLKYLMVLSMTFTIWSCSDSDLSIAPRNIISDEAVFSTEDGVEAYMSTMYTKLHIEDFRYSPSHGFHQSWVLEHPALLTGEALGRDGGMPITEFTNEYSPFFYDLSYELIREANIFLEKFPESRDEFQGQLADHFMGEAYFIRAFSYYALIKRYGGIPLITKVLEFPEQPIEELEIPRAPIGEVYDQILNDFDLAIELLGENSSLGRVNNYAAAAFKSRAMLHAGSVAKYNDITLNNPHGDGDLLNIDRSRAADYFREAYEAARFVHDSGMYQLYGLGETDPQQQYRNLVDLYQPDQKENPEVIFIRDYEFDDSVHGFDAYNVPRQLMGPNGYSSGTNPTLDFVEMFDGLPKNDDGTIEILDENGHYKMFDDLYEFFENAEPRLRANVIFPGDTFKGEQIEIWRGIYTNPDVENISKLVPENATDLYGNVMDDPENLVESSSPQQSPYELINGETMNPAGRSGVFHGGPHSNGSYTGFSLRKNLNESLTVGETQERSLENHWVELRYAEVLLNLAEAAVELDEEGESVDMSTAFNAITDIQSRAGAEVLDNQADLTKEAVRKERRKELAFENKILWDLRRWRIIENEQNSRFYRVLMPFYAEHANQWFFDARTNEYQINYTFDRRWYYQQIPTSHLEKNSKLVQNPGY